MPVTAAKTCRFQGMLPIWCWELKCPSCGIALYVRKRGGNIEPVKPGSYLQLAILVTVFCCFPFSIVSTFSVAQNRFQLLYFVVCGIVQTVLATQINRLHSKGKFKTIDSSRKAKMWAQITFVIGLIHLLVFFILILN